MDIMLRGSQDQEKGKLANPNDFTTWYIKQVKDHPDPVERSAEMIAKRLVSVNFAAIHTSTFTATNILL